MDRVLQILYIIGFLIFINLSYGANIAITFDDLPVNRKVSISELDKITIKILNGLQKQNISVIGFVNESKLYHDEFNDRVRILKKWVDANHLLGNHTYSHKSLHRVSIDDYQNGILMGEKITTELMKDSSIKYFRHPYLHTGTSQIMRNTINSFLQLNGYIVAPVTFDTDDWVFDSKYVEALDKKDNTKATEIGKAYLDHTAKKFEFYKMATKIQFNRDIDQIWLLHANSINADHIDELLLLAKSHGYNFITLTKVLDDEAYLTKDIYYEDFGVSWLYRWDYSNGLKVNWKLEPEPRLLN